MDSASYGKEVISKDIADQILALASQVDKASVFDANTQRPSEIVLVELDLSEARLATNPKIVKQPFKSIYVVEATDTNSVCYVKPISQDEFQGAIPFRDKDSWKLEKQVTDMYIHWPAQPGKKIILALFVNSSFDSGSFVTVIQGGVSISEGNIATMDRLAGNGAPQQVLPANPNRKIARIKNISDMSLSFSPSAALDENDCWSVNSGETFEWRSTLPLYCAFFKDNMALSSTPIVIVWEGE